MEFLMIHIFAFLLISVSFLNQCADDPVPTHLEIDQKRTEIMEVCLQNCFSKNCFKECKAHKQEEYIDQVFAHIDESCKNRYWPKNNGTSSHIEWRFDKEYKLKKLVGEKELSMDSWDLDDYISAVQYYEIATQISQCQRKAIHTFGDKKAFLEDRDERNSKEFEKEFKQEHPWLARCATNIPCTKLVKKLTSHW
jgi:hypothetical protein